MKTKETFALIIRVIGVLGIAYVIHNIVRSVLGGSQAAAIYYIIQVVYLCIGVYFLRGAPLVLNFAYPDKSATPAESTPVASSAGL